MKLVVILSYYRILAWNPAAIQFAAATGTASVGNVLVTQLWLVIPVDFVKNAR